MFQQEYEAKFVMISDPFFDYQTQILPNIADDWKQGHCLTTPCSLGIDWGVHKKSGNSISDNNLESVR